MTQLEHLLEKIRVRTATVGVIGLGSVGLPLALFRLIYGDDLFRKVYPAEDVHP